MLKIKIIILFVFVGIVIVGSVSFELGAYVERTKQNLAAGAELLKQKQNQNQELKLNFRVGRITAISDNTIEILALTTRNRFLEKDAAIKIKLKDTTKYRQILISRASLKNETQPQTPKLQEIKLSDLKIGDEITVMSDADVKGLTEFEAKIIQIVKLVE